jgi:hypothetical protein
MKLPPSHHQQFTFLFDFMTFNLWWSDIHYDTPEFDLKDVKIEMMDNEGESPMVNCYFPALKKFNVHAMQDCDSWWIPDKSKISLDFEDFTFDFSASVKVNDEGNLQPTFKKLHINFGESYLYYDNWFYAFVMH